MPFGLLPRDRLIEKKGIKEKDGARDWSAKAPFFTLRTFAKLVIILNA